MSPLEKLQAEVDNLQEEVADKDVRIVEQEEQIASLEERLRVAEHNAEVFRKLAIGPKSERRVPESNGKHRQTWLFEDELRERADELASQKGISAEVEVQSGEKPRKKASRRKKFPPHLPHVRTVIDLSPEDRTCCGRPMEEMGEQVTRELERIEVNLVHEIARKKYCCRECQENIKIAPAPDRVIDKGILGVGFIAHIITERFASHMPYYRQEKKYADEGLDLSRVTMCTSSGRAAELLEPIYDQVGRDTLESRVIHTDDTRVTEVKSKEGGRRTARFWIYADQKGNLYYEFTETRERDGPLRVLGNHKGYIQADAYVGYDRLYTPDGSTEVGCWAHARRKFDEAATTDKELSKEAVDRIRALYRVERVAKKRKLGPDKIQKLRQEHAAPILESLKVWLEFAATQVLPKSPMAGAIRYTLNQWEALNRYLESGHLEIDNNRAERALRPIAVGRKNWLHVINESGGKTAAILFTLVQTCKEIGIDPRVYLQDVLLRISHCSDVKSLTPHGWKETWAPKIMQRREALLAKLVDSTGK